MTDNNIFRFPSAAESREFADRVNNLTDHENQLLRIRKSIMGARKDGEYQFVFYENLFPVVREALVEAGYTVTVFVREFSNNAVTISWAEAEGGSHIIVGN